MRRRLDPSARARIAELYAQGEKVEAIAAAFAVVHSTVIHIARRAGVPLRAGRRTPCPPEMRQRIVAEFLAGDRPPEIARRHGLHLHTVQRFVRQAGHARPRGAAPTARVLAMQAEMAAAHAAGESERSLARGSA